MFNVILGNTNNHKDKHLHTVVGGYINTMKTTFYLSFDATSFFQITSLQEIKESFFNRLDSFSLFSCLCVVILL